MGAISIIPVTIANAGSLSNKAYIGHGKLVAIIMPDEWDAATLTFQGSADGETFNDIHDGTGAETEFQADASRHITVDDYAGAPWMKVRSGTSGSPAAQTPARIIQLVIQKFPQVGP